MGIPEVKMTRVKDLIPVHAGHMPEGAADRYILGNEHLGGSPTENLAIVVTTFEPGKGSGQHSHNVEESFMILRGYGTATIDGKTFPAEPDTIFYAPKNIKHEFTNTGHETMVLVAAFSKSTYSCDR